jgi:hypothetical protein
MINNEKTEFPFQAIFDDFYEKDFALKVEFLTVYNLKTIQGMAAK